MHLSMYEKQNRIYQRSRGRKACRRATANNPSTAHHYTPLQTQIPHSTRILNLYHYSTHIPLRMATTQFTTQATKTSQKEKTMPTQQLTLQERKVYDGRPKTNNIYMEYYNQEVPCYTCHDLHKCDSRNCIKLQAWMIANGGN